MPIYEYNCEKCNYKFDRLVGTFNTTVNCPICQGEVKKLMSSFSVGASNSYPGGIPAPTAAPMCTNCGPSPDALNKN